VGIILQRIDGLGSVPELIRDEFRELSHFYDRFRAPFIQFLDNTCEVSVTIDPNRNGCLPRLRLFFI
jgi:hypothetical protein